MRSAPTLRAARVALEGANADITTAGEALNPQLSVNSTAINFRNGTGSGAPWDKQADSVLRVDQQFERGGKRALRIQAAQAAETAAAADLADSVRTTRLSVETAYYDLKVAQESVGIATQLVQLQNRSLEAARLRLKNGDIASVDAARFEIEMARAEADLSSAETTRRGAQLTLAQLLGASQGETVLEATDEWPEPQTLATDSARVDARPDVEAAQARLQQAQKSYALARAQRTRDITFGVQFERNPQPLSNPNSWGVGFSVPLFLRNRYDGEIRRAAADRRSADEAVRTVRLSATTECERALVEMRGASDRLTKFQNSVIKRAKSAAEAAEYAYTHGALGLTDLLDARRALQAITLDELGAHAAYAKARAAWRAATEDSPTALVQ